jgi:hypothetical protein
MNDVMFDKFKKRITQKMRNVFSAAGIKIVQTNNLISVTQQSFTKVRAQKAGSTGYQDTFRHKSLLTSGSIHYGNFFEPLLFNLKEAADVNHKNI